MLWHKVSHWAEKLLGKEANYHSTLISSGNLPLDGLLGGGFMPGSLSIFWGECWDELSQAVWFLCDNLSCDVTYISAVDIDWSMATGRLIKRKGSVLYCKASSRLEALEMAKLLVKSVPIVFIEALGMLHLKERVPNWRLNIQQLLEEAGKNQACIIFIQKSQEGPIIQTPSWLYAYAKNEIRVNFKNGTYLFSTMIRSPSNVTRT